MLYHHCKVQCILLVILLQVSCAYDVFYNHYMIMTLFYSQIWKCFFLVKERECDACVSHEGNLCCFNLPFLTLCLIPPAHYRKHKTMVYKLLGLRFPWSCRHLRYMDILNEEKNSKIQNVSWQLLWTKPRGISNIK